ncbi:cytochrome p450 [Moniliophthora roreri]|nr:cytochrome p450 [Moniliophthora roreri]
MSPFIYALLVFLGLTLGRRVLQRKRKALRYPPGPSGSAIVGNFFDIPQKKPWVVYKGWARQYGDIMHLEMLGDHVVILNNVNIANDLLEKRSRIYSSRPYPEVAEVSGWGFNIAFQPYTDTWRKQRRTYQQHLRPNSIVELRPIIRKCVGIFLNNLLHTPDGFMGHIDLLSCSLALSSMYGLTIRSVDDPLLLLAKTTVHTLDTVWSTRYTFLVSFLPFIRIIPGWVPGLGSITRFINSTRQHCQDLREVPFNQVLRDLDLGSENDGLIARILKKGTIPADEFDRIKDMASMTLVASADTTLSSIGTFFLAMANNPQCQERAQREIDAVVGSDRLPSFDDRKAMPYVEAIYREVLRWHPAVPLGVPHVLTEDDTYNEYHLPQGCTVFANIWAMTHDERVYAEPYRFKPERFFDADGKLNNDDTVLAFGFGRRICVGKHLAEAALWLTIASVLTCFKISRAKDPQGNEIEIPEVYSDGPGQFSPGKFMNYIDVLASGLALKVMYGINVSTGDNPFISVAKSAVHTSDTIFEPYCIAVLRYCPFIMSIPRWVPVLGHVRRQVEMGREYISDLRELPIQRVQNNAETGAENDGIVPNFLRGLDIGDVNSVEKAHRIKDVASTVYTAAADTTFSSTGTFLAMARNPHSQKMAQREIDTVVGKGRLPNLGDRERLPGYFMPQGIMVFANIWAMTHDEEVYPEPYNFKPERFLNANTNINDVLAYGFGRRICVGRHLADAVLWLSFAPVLACFNIEKEKDEHGNETDPPENYSDGPGLFFHPLPFRYTITPRHADVESLIF